MLKYFKILFVFALLILIGCDGRNDNHNENLENTDTTLAMDTGVQDSIQYFPVKAASSGLMEVELGRMAQQKAQGREVKKFGEMMVNEHSKANAELKSLAGNLNMNLTDSLIAEHKIKMESMENLTGKQFDIEYMRNMVDAHQKDVQEFQRAANSTELDSTIRNWASKTLPALQKHLAEAVRINGKLAEQN